jgi:signal peptidase
MKNISKILLNIILIITLSINIINKLYDNRIVIIALVIYLAINLAIDGYRRTNKRDLGLSLAVVALGCFFTISSFYFMGTFSEFSRNYSFILYSYIKPITWIGVFLIVILTELIRYIAIQAPKGSKRTTKIIYISLFIIFILLDLSLSRKIINVGSFNSMYEFFSLTLCASLTKNIFLMWLTHKYGYIPCLVYRVIIDLYVYFLPIIPKCNMLIQACMFMLLPFILYKVIESFRTERDIPKANDMRKRKFDRIETAILIVFFCILAGLVSREFKYSMIAVGSGSMTGTIDKGDAIIYERYKGEPLHEGDIIVFKIENTLIVHRINKKVFLDEEYAYMTKGDFNKSIDNWIVESDMIVGKVVKKIPYIAWPSVWINENY